MNTLNCRDIEGFQIKSTHFHLRIWRKINLIILICEVIIVVGDNLLCCQVRVVETHRGLTWINAITFLFKHHHQLLLYNNKHNTLWVLWYCYMYIYIYKCTCITHIHNMFRSWSVRKINSCTNIIAKWKLSFKIVESWGQKKRFMVLQTFA